MSGPPGPGRTAVRLWAGLSLLLAAVAVVCLTVGLRLWAASDVRATPEPASPASSAPQTAPQAEPEPATAFEPVTPPVALRIPAIELYSDLVELGLNSDRTVEVPSDPDDTGWYGPGPVPGQPGSAVILGHVDSVRGPAVFYRLRYLQPGDRITVDAADGSTSTFRVVRVATYPNESFPAREVYAAPGRRRLLNLVTCGGAYDPESGYQANVVVYTRWVRDA